MKARIVNPEQPETCFLSNKLACGQAAFLNGGAVLVRIPGGCLLIRAANMGAEIISETAEFPCLRRVPAGTQIILTVE